MLPRMKRGVLWATAGLVLLNVAFFLVYLLRAPGSRTSSGENLQGTAGQAGVYAVTGVVKELRADGSNIVIRHEAIPGFMMAMTMPFTARDPREVDGLKAGDQVTFRLLVTADESWIDSVERVGAEEPPPFEQGGARIVRDVEPLEPGDLVPDYVFTNQFGRTTRLSDFRGNAVGVTFIFTRCPLPDFCPRMLKNFTAVAEALSSGPGPTNWHLVTITIDPAFDTPAVLRAHAESHQCDPRRWTFLTGALIDIDAITEQVGLAYRRETPTSLPDHTLRTFVIDPEGRLTRIVVGNTWSPEEVVEEMRAVAAGRRVEAEAKAPAEEGEGSSP